MRRQVTQESHPDPSCLTLRQHFHQHCVTLKHFENWSRRKNKRKTIYLAGWGLTVQYLWRLSTYWSALVHGWAYSQLHLIGIQVAGVQGVLTKFTAVRVWCWHLHKCIPMNPLIGNATTSDLASIMLKGTLWHVQQEANMASNRSPGFSSIKRHRVG